MAKIYSEEIVMAGAERTNDLNPKDKRTLLRLRQRLADQGIEIVPDQLIADLKQIDDICRACSGMGLVEFREECSLFDMIPPEPPYGNFDDELEARDFARRVFHYYKANYHVVPCQDGTCRLKYRLVQVD